MAAAAKKSYVPLHKREVNPLAPENFPSLGPAAAVASAPLVAATPKQSMNYLKTAKDGEEERARLEAEMAAYNRRIVTNQSKEQLESEGWEILYLSVARTPEFREWFYHANAAAAENKP